MKNIYLNLKKLLLTTGLLVSVMQVNAQNLSFQWARSMGDQATDDGVAIAVDNGGNVYTTGYFQGSADFDPGAGVTTLTAHSASGLGIEDVFVTKFDAAGNLVWAKNMGGNGRDRGLAIAVDTAGNVYTTGYFSDTADFDPGPAVQNLIPSANGDIFVSKLDANGNFVWAKQFTGIGTGGDQGTGIRLDAAGNVYTVGTFSGSVDFDPGAGAFMLGSAGSTDIFVSKLDNGGNFVWAKNMGGPTNDAGYGIAVDPAGNVAIIGGFTGTANFNPAGSFPLTSAPTYLSDIVVEKLDASGNFVWAKQLGGPSNDQGTAIALDTLGNVYTTGSFYGTADFDPSANTASLTSNGVYGADIFISKLDANGNYVWAKQLGSTADDHGSSITLDRYGAIYTTGDFQKTVDFDPGAGKDTLTANSISMGFISKLDTGGNYVWAKRMGGTQSSSIAVDASENVYTTGYFAGTVDFDPGPDSTGLTSNGSAQDIFIVKLACADTSSAHLTVTTCEGSYILNNQVLTTSGIYIQHIPNAAHCDSMITLDLTVHAKVLNPVITVNGFVLGTTLPYSSYQWLLNNSIMPGATNSTITVTTNGDYKVIVGNGTGCLDTSIVYTVTNVSVKDVASLAQHINIHPNPASATVYIDAPAPVNVRISSMDGKTVLEQTQAKVLNISNLAEGVYIINITDAEGRFLKIEKLVKTGN